MTIEQTAATPRVWLLMAYRAGERSQLLALAEALGWPFAIKRIAYRRYGAAIDLWRGSNLLGIDRSRSDALCPPWPEVVITAGMRNEPVGRWIRRCSGGRTRIVHMGRPWARLDRFDLVITTPQYRLRPHPRVLHNTTTVQRVTPERLRVEGQRWAARLAHLPPPYVAVLVGGNSGPYTFGPKAAARLAGAATSLARTHGASLLVSTSARTPRRSTEVLEGAIEAPSMMYRWHQVDHENPYYGFLALADRLVVTGDSVAMLSEACATGKPVHLFELGCGARTTCPPSPAPERCDFRLTAVLYRLLMRIGPGRLSRDVGLVHRALIASGRAACLGVPFPEGRPPPLEDVERAVARLRALCSVAPSPR